MAHISSRLGNGPGNNRQVELRSLVDLSYGGDWSAESPNIRVLSPTAEGGVAVLSDQTSQPLSYESYDAEGQVVSTRVPVEVDGTGVLHFRPGGEGMISVRTSEEVYVANVGGDFQAMEAGCSGRSVDVLPLEGNTFAWALACDVIYPSLTISIWSGGNLLVQRSINAPTGTVRLGRGPGDSIVLIASSTRGAELHLLDGETLMELATGELRNEEGSHVNFQRVTQVTSAVDNVVALGAAGTVNGDLRLERLALARLCPPT